MLLRIQAKDNSKLRIYIIFITSQTQDVGILIIHFWSSYFYMDAKDIQFTGSE